MKEKTKIATISLTLILLLTLSISYYIIYPTNSDSIYHTPSEILNLNVPIGNTTYVQGTITSATFNAGAGQVTLNNNLTLSLAMSTNNSHKLVITKEYTTLTAKIQKTCNCDISWEIIEIIGE